MAYRFHLKAPVGKEARRIMLEQIERAERHLTAGLEGGDAEARAAVHETRKAMKRIRALLKLIRPGLTNDQYNAENARFREIGAHLAASRDRAVMIETLNSLAARHETLADPVANLVRHLASEPYRDANGASNGHASGLAPHSDLLAEAHQRLHATKHYVRRLRLSPDSFDLIEEGLKQGFKRAVRFQSTAAVTNDDEDVHSWRKAVQQHWRHMALLQRAWPDVFLARVSLARRISQLLGDDHDLSVVTAALGALPFDAVPEAQRQQLLDAALTDQRRHRADAHLLSSLLFAGTPKGFAKQVHDMWLATSALPEEARPQRPVSGEATA